MAVRPTEDVTSNSTVPGLNYFWQEAEKEPSYDWEQWQQLFEVAVLARHSISVSEITRNVEEQNPLVITWMGNLEKNAAARKLISLQSISLGKTGRNMIMDKFPQIKFCPFNCPTFYNSATSASKQEEIERWTDIPFGQGSKDQLNIFTSSGMFSMGRLRSAISAIRQKVWSTTILYLTCPITK